MASNPSDQELEALIRPLLLSASDPANAPGAASLRKQLLASHPEWQLSEKRVKALLAPLKEELASSTSKGEANGTTSADAGNDDADDQDEDDDDEGTAAKGSTNGGDSSAPNKKKKKKPKKKPGKGGGGAASSKESWIPSSHIDPLVAVPPGVKPHYFDSVKGKGLLATREYREGETIFTEDAFVPAPPSQAVLDVANGSLCGQCFLPVVYSSMNVACGQKGCQMRFCNRICQGRAQSTHHQLLCQGQNPSIKPFNDYIEQHKWLSLSSVSRALARVLLTHSANPPPSLSSPPSVTREKQVPATLEEMMGHLDAFATVSELERRARNPGWRVEAEGFISAMREGLRLLEQGMNPHSSDRVPARQGANEAVVAPSKPRFPVRDSFPKDVARSLFSWETFLRFLGRANLNMEGQGGLYVVHSMLNHSCDPNAIVRHPPNRSGVRQATKVAVVALRGIAEGEEILISYQPLDVPLARRRLLLWREYMFGPCVCSRCQRELDALPSEEREEMDNGAWTRSKEDEEEVKRRMEHAQRLTQMERERREKLEREGRLDQKDLSGLENEIREKLGF